MLFRSELKKSGKYDDEKIDKCLADMSLRPLEDLEITLIDLKVMNDERSEERRVGKECRSRW